jgi:hypothetical protein
MERIEIGPPRFDRPPSAGKLLGGAAVESREPQAEIAGTVEEGEGPDD